jgi:predicted ATP-grasp superfamily ATP-dependent carboligase
MVEFKDDTDGVPHVVEVNPKLWGSFDLSLASGVNFLDKLIQTVNGKKITNESYEKGLIFSWFFDDGWRSAKQNKTMLKEFLSILTGKYKTNATRRDIVPSFRLFWTFFRKLLF